MSNDLYGIDTVSTFQLKKCITNPLKPHTKQFLLPNDLRRENDELLATFVVQFKILTNNTTSDRRYGSYLRKT